MLLKYIYDSALAQASYLVASSQTQEAVVIDPARDITPYLDIGTAENLRITHVLETHIHADFVSGARELAARTGARLCLSAMGGTDWQYEFADHNTTLLRDGDTLSVGEMRLTAIHTPGHTPEHLIFALTDTATGSAPVGLFTGDCLFVGDVGRPDLLELAAGQRDTKTQGARQQYRNMQRLKTMPDYLQVWPGHGAGSACGKALGAMPSTTLGYEKLFNPAFQCGAEADFVRWLLTDQPEMPRYFAQMKRVNKRGPDLLKKLRPPQRLEGFVLQDALREGALVIDARRAEEFRNGHAPGAISIPPTNKFSTYAGNFIDYAKPTYLIAPPDQVDSLVHDLRAIGVDLLPGFFPPAVMGTHLVRLDSAKVADVAAHLDELYLLDVRGASEWAEGHIAGAHHLPLPEMSIRWQELPRDKRIMTYCASGERSQVAASFLQRQGFDQAAELEGGIDAWKAAGLPLERVTANT